MLKYATALALVMSTGVMATGAAFAQGATQSPPSPNGSVSSPQPATSVPAGAMNINPSSTGNPNASGALGATATTGAAPQGNAPSGGMARTVPKPQ